MIRPISLTLATFAIANACLPINGASAQAQAITPEQLLGNKTYKDIAAQQDYSSAAGNINIAIKRGQSIADGLPIGSIPALGSFTPETALQAAGINMDLGKAQLGELKFLGRVPLENLVAVDPTLKDIKASAIGWASQGEKTLGDIAGTPAGKLPVPDDVLKATSIADFGNIAKIPYSQFPTAANLPITEFPGLAEMPIAKSIGNITGPNIRLVRVDRIRTNEKNFNSKVVSGSDQRPLAKWDKGTPVSGVELQDSVISDKSNLVNGAVAIIGATQMLPGGNVPSPLEPTGFKIPGTPFKLSFENPNAKAGTVQLQLNMQLDLGWGLRTSHFIPIPTGIEVSEKSRTTLIPLEVPTPNPIAAAANQVQASPAAGAAITRPAQEQVVKQESPAGGAEQIKASALGEAVKFSTNPATGANL